MRRLLVAAALIFLAASCSVPTEDTAQVISDDDLPETLRRDASPTTTTTIARSNEPFTYYLLQQRAEQDSRFVVAVTRQIEINGTRAEQLAPLFGDDFVTPEEEEELVNPTAQLDLVAIDITRGVATVQVEIESLTDLQRLGDVAAQLVWTLTELDEIDAILIEVNGELQPIPTQDGDVSVSVRKEDFPRYNRDFEFPEAPEEPSDTDS